MITIYESERLIDLIRRENNHIVLPLSGNYNYECGLITVSTDRCNYSGPVTPFNILPRLIRKHLDGKAYEAHLQMYIVQNLGRNKSLDNSLGISSDCIEWIGNEVSCGVGMQRIDIMLSKIQSTTQRIIMPIELKAVHASEDNIRQIERYIDWIEQYYIPNRMSTIQPVLLCRAGGLTDRLRQRFNRFNSDSRGRFLPLRYIEYSVDAGGIQFNNMDY